MANETKYTVATTINAVSGATSAVNNDAFNASGDKGAVTNANTSDYLYLKLELRMTFNGTGTLVDGAAVNCYFRRDGIGGATQAPEPDADYKHDLQGSWKVDKNNSTTEQVLTIEGVPNPINEDFEIWIENKSGKNSATGWDIDVVPYTFVPIA